MAYCTEAECWLKPAPHHSRCVLHRALEHMQEALREFEGAVREVNQMREEYEQKLEDLQPEDARG